MHFFLIIEVFLIEINLDYHICIFFEKTSVLAKTIPLYDAAYRARLVVERGLRGAKFCRNPPLFTDVLQRGNYMLLPLNSIDSISPDLPQQS